MTGCGKFFMISYIFQGILGNVVNLEFNSPFRIETRKGAHQDGCWIPLSRENGWCVVWLCNKRSVCWKGTFELKIMHLVLSNICGEYLCVFLFFGGLFNFLSCRVGVYSWVGTYSIASILQVIRCRRYSNFCTWYKEMQGNFIMQITMIQQLN